MRHFYEFNNIEEADSFVYTPDYIEPSIIKIGSDILYNYKTKVLYDKVFDKNDYLSIYALQAGTFQYTLSGELEYSLNNSEWTIYSEPISCNAGDIIRLRGNNQTYYSGSTIKSTFYYSGYYILYGNIDSLTCSDRENNFINPSVSFSSDRLFGNLFYNNDKLLSIKYLSLPCTGGKAYCCARMFMYCTSLIDVCDSLPMFSYGSGNYKFQSMFSNCEKLGDAGNLTINVSGQYDCQYMFSNCINLQQLPKIYIPDSSINYNNTDFTKYGCSYMFNNCKNLTNANIKLKSDYSQYIYSHMFQDCSSLIYLPKLEGKLGSRSCEYMFLRCKSLKRIPKGYFDNITYISTYGFNGMFTDCTALETVSDLPNVWALTSSCYSYMFQGCTSLKSVGKIKTMIAGDNSFTYMFSGCSNLQKSPEIYVFRFIDTTSFQYMFFKCSKLKEITIHTSKSNFSQNGWLSGINNKGTIYITHGCQLAPNSLPQNWEIKQIWPEYRIEPESIDLQNKTDEELYNLIYNLYNSHRDLNLFLLNDTSINKVEYEHTSETNYEIDKFVFYSNAISSISYSISKKTNINDGSIVYEKSSTPPNFINYIYVE